jgi:hypothetical protein
MVRRPEADEVNRIGAVYGPNYQRLVRVKKRDGEFRHGCSRMSDAVGWVERSGTHHCLV